MKSASQIYSRDYDCCSRRSNSRPRFDVEHVESGAPDPAVAQALDQRLFVDDRTARGVHKPRIRFHERQFVRPDQPLRALAQYWVHRSGFVV
jgi:hypothetical protein